MGDGEPKYLLSTGTWDRGPKPLMRSLGLWPRADGRGQRERALLTAHARIKNLGFDNPPTVGPPAQHTEKVRGSEQCALEEKTSWRCAQRRRPALAKHRNCRCVGGRREHPTSAAPHSLPGTWTARTMNASSTMQAEETGEQDTGSLRAFPPPLGRVCCALDLRRGPDRPNVNKAQQTPGFHSGDRHLTSHDDAVGTGSLFLEASRAPSCMGPLLSCPC